MGVRSRVHPIEGEQWVLSGCTDTPLPLDVPLTVVVVDGYVCRLRRKGDRRSTAVPFSLLQRYGYRVE